jgi:hypothetical protein
VNSPGEDHRLIFVGGLHRSGTSMLARTVAEHPAVSAFTESGVPEDEGQHLQTVYPKPSAAQQAGRFAFVPGAHLTESSPLVTEANRRRLFAEWAGHWDMERPQLLEKSPPNLIMTRFLQALFPDARFVIVIRHPIAVACATQKWSGSRPHELIRHWLVAHEMFAADAPLVHNLLVVRYESMVEDPDACFGRVFAFLGLDDPAPGRTVAPGVNSDNFRDDRQPRSEVNERYFASWDDRRRRFVKRTYLDLVELGYERRARRFGYSLRRPRIAPFEAPALPPATPDAHHVAH